MQPIPKMLVIPMVIGCHIFWQISSQWDQQKLLEGSVSHLLTTHISDFSKFLMQWKVLELDNFKLTQFSKVLFYYYWNSSLQFITCESWRTQLTLAISPWGINPPLIRKKSVSHKYALAVYGLENSESSFFYFQIVSSINYQPFLFPVFNAAHQT